ncbi:MAG TPA: hypothetical protein VF438_00805 [Candidatus Paceibacterota bacterium]
MLTPYLQSQFVEKILTDVNGRQFKALFLVSLVNEKVSARLVSLQIISPKCLAIEGAISQEVFFLPSYTSHEAVETPYIASVAPFVSPYFDLDIFLSTQPTRAPAHR